MYYNVGTFINACKRFLEETPKLIQLSCGLSQVIVCHLLSCVAPSLQVKMHYGNHQRIQHPVGQPVPSLTDYDSCVTGEKSTCKLRHTSLAQPRIYVGQVAISWLYKHTYAPVHRRLE